MLKQDVIDFLLVCVLLIFLFFVGGQRAEARTDAVFCQTSNETVIVVGDKCPKGFKQVGTISRHDADPTPSKERNQQDIFAKGKVAPKVAPKVVPQRERKSSFPPSSYSSKGRR